MTDDSRTVAAIDPVAANQLEYASAKERSKTLDPLPSSLQEREVLTALKKLARFGLRSIELRPDTCVYVDADELDELIAKAESAPPVQDLRQLPDPSPAGEDAETFIAAARGSVSAAPAWRAMDYQARVRSWVLDCFGEVIANDMTERSFRFLEEALELAQSVGCTREQAHALVDYVHGRPAGQPSQEVGGVMVTLAAFTSAAGIDMMGAAETELARINTPETIAKIRRKQASKRGVVSHAAQAALPGEWNDPLPRSPRAGEETP